MKNYKSTIVACFVGYIVQAIVNNFIPLLFLTFQKSYDIELSKITMLITFNFGIQLLVDMICPSFVDKIGYRVSMVLAHVFSAAGLISLTILPSIMDPFAGLFLSVVIYAVGGGLLEVLVSPVVEACPTDNKEKAMSLLHSFYCWGHVGVVLLSTLFFFIFGISSCSLFFSGLISCALCAVSDVSFISGCGLSSSSSGVFREAGINDSGIFSYCMSPSSSRGLLCSIASSRFAVALTTKERPQFRHSATVPNIDFSTSQV